MKKIALTAILVISLFMAGCDAFTGPEPAPADYEPWDESCVFTFENLSSCPLEITVLASETDEALDNFELAIGESKRRVIPNITIKARYAPIYSFYDCSARYRTFEDRRRYLLFVD